MTKKIKKVIAQVLLITMVLPNISARATENTLLNDNKESIENTDVVVEETYEEPKQEVSDDNNLNEDINAEDSNGQIDNSTSTEENDNIDESKTEDITNENTSEEIVDEKKDESLEQSEIVDEKYEIETYSTKNNMRINEEAISTLSSDYSTYINERYEFELKAQEMQTYSRLRKKTNANYEIAMAHEDGSYTYLGNADTIDEAIDEVDNTPSTYSDENSQPVVINSDGQVVYSTYSLARIYKHINGKPYPYFDKNSNLYSDAALTKTFTYINQGYVDDAPILEFNGSTSAKILVSGYEGWINMNTKASEYDIVVVPINQVKNPSYYQVKNGILYHFISSNLTSGSSGHKLEVGKAPSYLVEGRYYFSYDGKYFYDGGNITSGMTSLIMDYRNGTRGRAINANDPYYSYYKNLPFRSKTIYTASEINSFIASNTGSTSKLRNAGHALKNAESIYGVNALLALGIAINESAWGMSSIAQSKNNIFGLNAVDSNPGLAANEFPSVEACITDFAKNWISRGYADPADWRYYGGFLGNKSLGANVKYASDPFWGEKAAKYALLADLYLSGNINSLQDTNAYQLAIYTDTNEVWNSGGSLLYKVNNNFNEYSSYVGVPVILTNPDKVYINGRESYEIYADRNTAVGSGGTANKYHGNYNWTDRGYIKTSGVKFINKRRDVKPIFSVIGGSSRYNTAVELSKSKFNTSDTVVLVNSSAIIDGVTASALATGLNAPVLLADSNSLTTATTNELKRLGAKKVFLVGGEGVLGNGVINSLKNIGVTNVTRLGGSSRYDTALQVAKYIDANIYDISEVFLVYGEGEADALTAGAISGQKNIPILLTGTKSMNSQVKSFLSAESLKNAYVIGGEGVISGNVLNELNSITSNNISGNRLGGSNRFETNAKVIERFYGNNLNSIYVSKGYELIDALTAGPIAAMDDSPIVIVGDYLTQAQKDVLSKKSAARIIQAGLGVSPTAVNTLRSLINIYCL